MYTVEIEKVRVLLLGGDLNCDRERVFVRVHHGLLNLFKNNLPAALFNVVLSLEFPSHLDAMFFHVVGGRSECLSRHSLYSEAMGWGRA